MTTRILKKCRKCGMLNRWSKRNNICVWCKNTTYDEIEFQDYTEDEKELVISVENELLYILDKSFNEIKPTEDDYFGSIEMCDYLKKKYNLDDTVYELAGMINLNLTRCEHSKFVPEFGNSNVRITGITLADGRLFNYRLVYYENHAEDEYPDYKKLSAESIEVIETDITAKLNEIITAVIKFKPCSTGAVDLDDPTSDFDFSLEEMEKARTKSVNYVKSLRDRIKANEARNKWVEENTKPIKNTDPNYIESAECPNCHKKSVYRISDIKRGASIGFFGLFSKNIGKTMECRSCGYKW